MWDHGVSDGSEGNATACSAACWAIGSARPKRRSGTRAREASRPQAAEERAALGRSNTGRGERVGLPGRKQGREVKLLFLFFLFKYFKAFSNYFKSSFEFESNHSNQKFKCNSMSAQTCFYPYI
jgi:hypothetical protein